MSERCVTDCTSGSSKKYLKFEYDAMGQRVAKHVYDDTWNWEKSTYYVRDPQGNVMAVYDQQVQSSTMSYKVKERDIYGSSRVGMYTDTVEMIGAVLDTTNSNHVMGARVYELSNHLGNVLATITDKVIPKDWNSDATIDNYHADLVTSTDYYAFGVTMKLRDFEKKDYRIGFNGMEKDNELYGDGNSYDFGARLFNPRLARWSKMDAYSDHFSFISPYGYCENTPVNFIDPTGNFVVDPTLKKEFPNVALILENADKLYNGQPLPADLAKALEGVDIQKVFNEDFKKALELYSTLSNSSIQEALTPGKGPYISAADLDITHAVNGYTQQEIGPNGQVIVGQNQQIKNEKNELIADGHLKISRYIVEVLEYEMGGNPETWGGSGFGGAQRDNADKSDAFDSFVSTLFHEFVHYGRNKSGAGNSMPPGPNGEPSDYGARFEIAVWGKNVTRFFKDWLMRADGTRPERKTPAYIEELEHPKEPDTPVEAKPDGK